jgi:hypothetical protein
MGIGRLTEKSRFHVADGVDAFDYQLRETAIICEEEIDARLGSAGKVDRVCGRNTMFCPYQRKSFSSVDCEREEFDKWWPKRAPDLFGCLFGSSFVKSGKDLSNGENTGAETIPALRHLTVKMVDAARVIGVIFKPVKKNHRVPVNEAQSRCRPSGHYGTEIEGLIPPEVEWLKCAGRRNACLIIAKQSFLFKTACAL